VKQHISKVSSSCFYHLRHLRQIRRRFSSQVAGTFLVLALVKSRLNYCNSLLAGVPQTTIAPLQRVQNAAARLIFELGTREHVTVSLLQLQWLPVCWRVQFKLCCLMHSIFYGKCLSYLDNIVSHVSIAVVLVAVSDLHRQRTSYCHGYVPSLASVPLPTPASLRGTLYPRT